MRFASLALLLVLAPVEAEAQCTASPSVTSFPDDPPVLSEPAAAIIARASVIEAMPAAAANWFRATFDLAEAYRATGATEDEVRTWARLIESAPTAPSMDQLLFRLGGALMRLGRPETARTLYARLLSRHPSSPYVEAVYVAFGEHYAHEGDLDAARQFFERAARTPGRWAVYVAYRSAWARAALRDPGAVVDFDRAMTLSRSSGSFVPPALRSALVNERSAVLALSACPPQ